MATHPTITPPVRTTSKPLPVTPLPNGQMTPPVTSATVGAPAAPQQGPLDFFSSVSNGTILFSLIGIGVVVLAGLGWILSRRGP